MAEIDPLLKYQPLKSFKRDNLWGNEFSHMLASITMSWGNVEYRLFWLLQAIDRKKAADWAAQLFSGQPKSLNQQKELILKEVKAAVATSYPEFIVHLKDQFKKMKSIQGRRNKLSHGLWLAGPSEATFVIQPLNYEQTGLVQQVPVDLSYLSTLIEDMEFLEQGMAALTIEMLAHQQLKQWGKR